MKKLLIVPVFMGLFFLGSCEDKVETNPDELEGKWVVTEVGGLYDGISYEVSITKDPNKPSYIYIANFLDLANDPETQLLNFMLSVKVEGSRFVINPQQVDVVEILSSTGIVNSTNQFRIEYNYRTDNSTYNATSYFIRN